MSTFNPNPDFRPRKQQKIWQKKWFPLAAVGLIALFIGVGLGNGGTKTVEVTKEVPGPERIVTKTIEKEKTPQACITALNLSEEGFSYSAEAMGYMSDALTAAGNFDVVGLEKASANLNTLNPKMKQLTSPMKEASAQCRAAAR